ncbi:Swi3-domain-containing protein [Xylariomycetidae sp. FL0641]|nr:Swi3-domain-containing protein [Xylariomycetidae sp. FL0641]
MATAQGSRPSKPLNTDINNYDIDDPFASENEREKNASANSNKRKGANALGIDEEVSVAKKARVPRVKLDESRLLSEKGIPRLRRKAGDLKFKGKGHEFSDAARLLSFYQLWLDDLFPKAKFLDALGMVEKTGHKKYMRMKRMEWIDDLKPKPNVSADFDEIFGEANEPEEREPAKFPARVAPIFENRPSQRPKTPVRDSVFGDDEDLYDATPRQPAPNGPGLSSIFGHGGDVQQNGEPDDDELDALMAEEEAHRAAPTSIFGNGGKSKESRSQQEFDEDDLDALMAEAEAQPSVRKPAAAHEEDDLDALMAEAEAENQANLPKPSPAGFGAKGKGEPTNEADLVDEDAEAAMAEMGGLW